MGQLIFEFGTGCLKVTPAHDINDYELGKKYKLETIDIFTDNGKLNVNGLHYAGKDRFEVRKEIAKELNVPVIALSQLSRSVEQRGGDKRPVLSDLRESGAIEQDADIVSFIYRPEYYDLTQDADGNSTLGMGEIIIAKHRNGALKNVRLRFVPEFARFENLDEVEALDLPGTTNAGLNQFNQEFSTYTIKSKMDDSSEDIFSKDDADEDAF